MPSSYPAQGSYQQQPTPPPPYTPSMSPISQINQQMGHMVQTNSVTQSMAQMSQPVAQMGQMPPMGPATQMSQLNPMGQVGQVAQVAQVPQTPQTPQVPPLSQIPQPGIYGSHVPQQGPRPMSRRRKSTLQYQTSPMATALSPPVTPGAIPSPYMSISDVSGNPPNCYDIKPQVVPSTASPQGYEDIKPPRLNSK